MNLWNRSCLCPRTRLAGCLLFTALVLTAPAHAQLMAQVDRTFGAGGTVTVDAAGGPDAAYAVTTTPSGHVLVAGRVFEGTGGANAAVVRLRPDGTLDPAFGRGGIATIPLPGPDVARAVAVQPDGRIVVAGAATGAGSRLHDLLVMRLLPNGRPDPSFGTGGVVITDLGGNEAARAVVVYPRGPTPRIIVAGSTNHRIVLAAYTDAGTPAPGFGTNGVLVTAISSGGDVGHTLTSTPDGALLVGGAIGRDVQSTFDTALARYTLDGRPDRTFGRGGVVATTLAQAASSAHAVRVQPDGRIVVASTVGGGQGYRAVLTRYRPDGRLDPTFGDGGHVPLPGAGDAVANGLCLPAPSGTASMPAGPLTVVRTGTPGERAPQVYRVTPDGRVDSTFATERLPVRGVPWRDVAAVACASDGRLLVAGTGGLAPPGTDLHIARYRLDPPGWRTLSDGLRVPGWVELGNEQ